jgi:hypothetical protein
LDPRDRRRFGSEADAAHPTAAAVEGRGLGPFLYEELRRAVRDVVISRNFPPSLVKRAHWDADAIWELVNDLVVNRFGVVVQGGFDYDTVAGFRAYIRTVFYRFFLNKYLSPTTSARIFSRIAEHLKTSDRFAEFATGSETRSATTRMSLWGLKEWGKTPLPVYGGSTETLAQVPQLRGS